MQLCIVSFCAYYCYVQHALVLDIILLHTHFSSCVHAHSSHTPTHIIPTPHTPTHTVLLYAAALGVYADTEQHFAGFLTINGAEIDGCFSYGFGIALAGFIVNIIASIFGFAAIIYGMCFKKNNIKK